MTLEGTVSFDGAEAYVTGSTSMTVPLSFSTWSVLRGSGEFGSTNADYGQPNGLVYAFSSSLQPGDTLLDIGWLNGLPVIEIPVQDPSTLTFVDVFLEGTADMALANWTLDLMLASDQSGLPVNRCRWTPVTTNDHAFFRLKAVLK